MNINTFFNIYYKHRFKKTKNIIKKIYLILIVPLNYIIEKVTLQKFLDLDKYRKENKQLFKKNLNYLFQHFNSDKGKRFLNQYLGLFSFPLAWGSIPAAAQSQPWTRPGR